MDLPIENGDFPASYVGLPEAKQPGHHFSAAGCAILVRTGKDLRVLRHKNATMWPPSDVSWLTKAPETIVICVP